MPLAQTFLQMITCATVLSILLAETVLKRLFHVVPAHALMEAFVQMFIVINLQPLVVHVWVTILAILASKILVSWK